MTPAAVFIAAGLIAGVLAIIVLCWVWMSASRASQGRQEAHQQRLLKLLEEQNRLLERFLDRQ